MVFTRRSASLPQRHKRLCKYSTLGRSQLPLIGRSIEARRLKRLWPTRHKRRNIQRRRSMAIQSRHFIYLTTNLLAIYCRLLFSYLKTHSLIIFIIYRYTKVSYPIH